MSDATPGTPVISANGNTQTNTSLSVAYPAANATQDTLMVVEISGDATGTGVAPTGMAAAGWTRASPGGEAVDTNSGTATSSSYIGVFYKVMAAGSASGSASFTWTNAGQMCAICTPYTNFDTTTPVVFLAGQEKAASDANYSVSGTTTDTGLLAYAFANRAGSTAFSALSDNARTQATVGTTGCTVIGRVTATSVANGTAFTKTATGTNTSVGTSVAYLIRGAGASTDTATVPMAQTSSVSDAGSDTTTSTLSVAQINAVSVTPGAGSSASLPVAQTSAVSVTGQQTEQSAPTMAQTNVITASPQTLLSAWLVSTPLYVAHRGGDNDWVEMTRDAYTHAIANGAKAINIDAVKCSTGEFVASHDLTTGRVFGTNLTIASSSWSSLSGLTTTTGGFPIEKVADLLAAFPNVVVFVENKGNSSDDAAFLDMLDAAGGPGRIVVKQYYTAATVSTDAHARGYTTWGYYFATDVAQLGATHSRWDLLGLDYTDTNSTDWSNFLATGKKVLGHVIPSAAGAAQAFSEGANGIMTGKVLGVVPGNQDTATLAMVQTSSVSAAGNQASPAGLAVAQTSSIGVVGSEVHVGITALTQVNLITVIGNQAIVVPLALGQANALALTGASNTTANTAATQVSVVTIAGQGTNASTLAVMQTQSINLAPTFGRIAALAMPQASALSFGGLQSLTVAVMASQTSSMGVSGVAGAGTALSMVQSSGVMAVGAGTVAIALSVTQTGIVDLAGSLVGAVILSAAQVSALNVAAALSDTATLMMAQSALSSLAVSQTIGVALSMTGLGGLELASALNGTSSLTMAGGSLLSIAPIDLLPTGMMLTGTSRLDLAALAEAATPIRMVAVNGIDLTAATEAAPTDLAGLTMSQTGMLALVVLLTDQGLLAIRQSSTLVVGTNIPVIRRHIRLRGTLGTSSWSGSIGTPR